MQSGNGSTTIPKKRYKFEIISEKGQRITYNYLGESAEQVEEMLKDNIRNAKSIKFVRVVHTYQAHNEAGDE
jgi:hypothetical protein